MLSRVADSIYWMSRYIERAENVARFVEVNLNLMLDFPVESIGQQWQPLVATTGDHAQFAAVHADPTRANVIDFLTFDRRNPNSIIACLSAARENARVTREIITSTMWEQLNTFYLLVHAAASADHRVLPDDFFARVRAASHLFTGITDATMSHGEAWHFCRLGRQLERADKTTRILDLKYYFLLPALDEVGTPIDDLVWTAVLRSASAFEMYRKRHGRITPDGVVDFLLLDREFPRAVLHCLIAAEESLHAIAGTPSGTFRNSAEQRLGQLRSELAYAAVDEMIAGGLHQFLDGLQAKLNRTGAAIRAVFFAAPASTPGAMVPPARDVAADADAGEGDGSPARIAMAQAAWRARE
jgi:uncharacterized alpha-E superfamily protein